MKIALTRKNKSNNTTPRYKSSIAKKTYPIKITKLVPNFATRWRSICKYFISSENKRSRKNDARYNNNIKKTPHAYTQKENPKKDLEQSSQSHYNSHFNLNKQAYTQHEAALQKEQSDAPCNFMKLIISI